MYLFAEVRLIEVVNRTSAVVWVSDLNMVPGPLAFPGLFIYRHYSASQGLDVEGLCPFQGSRGKPVP